jgi:hypothetical protein
MQGNDSLFSAKVDRQHFAVVKGWLSGLDLGEMGKRYLKK